MILGQRFENAYIRGLLAQAAASGSSSERLEVSARLFSFFRAVNSSSGSRISPRQLIALRSHQSLSGSAVSRYKPADKRVRAVQTASSSIKSGRYLQPA